MDVLLASIVFFFIGRLSVDRSFESKTVTAIKRKIKRTPKAGVLPFKQAEEFTDEFKEDKKIEKIWKDSGFANKLGDD